MVFEQADLSAWAGLIEAARTLGRPGFVGLRELKRAVKKVGSKEMPPGHRDNKDSCMFRLWRGCQLFASLHPDQKAAKALELRQLAEATAEVLDLPHDHAAAEAANPVRRARVDIEG